MVWVALVLSLCWIVFLLWPRTDGGNIPFALSAVAPIWFSFGPLALIWSAYLMWWALT